MTTSPRAIRVARAAAAFGFGVALLLGGHVQSASGQATPTSPATAPTVPTVPRRSTAATPRRTTTQRTTKPRTTTVVARGSYKVSGTAGRGLAVREAPGVGATSLGRKAEGAALKIQCQVKGELVRDTAIGRSSTLWDKLTTGGYVANIYTTAYDAKRVGYSAGLAACAGVTPTAPPATSATATTIAVAATAAGPSVPSTATGPVSARVLVTTTSIA